MANTDIESKIGQILKRNSLTVTAAESCTGGLINSRLTDVSGSSAYIKQGFVVYSNEAKEKYLNVKNSTLNKFGAVSEETVSEMLDGILHNTDSDIAIAISGIAGPNSDDTLKPVGLVYFGAANSEKKTVVKFQAEKPFERKEMKYLFSQKALELLLNFLEENYK